MNRFLFKRYLGGVTLGASYAVSCLANGDIQTGVAISTVSNTENRRLCRANATRNLAITQRVIRRKAIKNFFSRVHTHDYTRMDSTGQYVNEQFFAKTNSRLNTGGAMKTPAQLIATAIDSAMETANNGRKP